jgi:hypothetical protein
MKPRPVLIEWDDSTHITPGGWIDREVATTVGSCSIVTVGWLIADDDDTVTICQSITEADDCTGTFAIPKAVVRKMKKLGKP